jgi:hypothetical protein
MVNKGLSSSEISPFIYLSPIQIQKQIQKQIQTQIQKQIQIQKPITV